MKKPLKTKYVMLKVTQLELLALVDCIDTVSALSDQIGGDTRKDINKVDRALKRNGFKRQYT